jgi:hypothetical protein
MDFGDAIRALKRGERVARSGWNGKGMWLVYVPGTPQCNIKEGTPYHSAGRLLQVDINPHVDMFTADGKMQPGWISSQEDMLAEDWAVVTD